MATQTAKAGQSFTWTIQPDAARRIHQLLDTFCQTSAAASHLAQRLHSETGTRLIDWIDHFALPDTHPLVAQLPEAGFQRTAEGDQIVWQHPAGMFPRIFVHEQPVERMAIRVESVADFLVAHNVSDVEIEGLPRSQLRKARFASEGGLQLWVVERHGERGWNVPSPPQDRIAAALRHHEALRRRRRDFAHAEGGFEHALQLIRSAQQDLDTDWTCDLFFSAEREYWQRRNRAAQVQKARQDSLGLGWANHDHHTYRSSRKYFTQLVQVLEQLGFHCRERFYGGHGAGWGAQVLEQPTAGIVIFADVDLTPDEVTGDFAHHPLPPQDRLGTVGLWCKLHGEAMLQAGMHHLECQFDFDAAREQLARAGIPSMQPFTDFPHLKQAFTTGEVWPVDPRRINVALEEGVITAAQAEQFRASGALGSHLEILQRDDGYKGFNQTGIDEIITKTDPRRAPSAEQPQTVAPSPAAHS